MPFKAETSSGGWEYITFDAAVVMTTQMLLLLSPWLYSLVSEILPLPVSGDASLAVPLCLVLAEITCITAKRLVMGWQWRRPGALRVITAFLMMPAVPFFIWVALTKAGPEWPAMAVFFIHFPVSFILLLLGVLDGRFAPIFGVDIDGSASREEREGPNAGEAGDSPVARQEQSAHTSDGSRRPKRSTVVGLLIAIGLCLLGLAGWWAAGLSGLGVISPPADFQMPPGDIGDIEVDSRGRVYLALGFYGRIQAYDADRGFLHGWQVPTGGGKMKVEMNDDGRLDVAAHRVNEHFTYSTSGDMLGREDVDAEYVNRFGDGTPLHEEARDGSVYRVKSSWLFPRVVKSDETGRRSVVVSTPIYLWFWMAPLPAFAWLTVGVTATLVVGLRLTLQKGG